jgi:hypothetical protein
VASQLVEKTDSTRGKVTRAHENTKCAEGLRTSYTRTRLHSYKRTTSPSPVRYKTLAFLPSLLGSDLQLHSHASPNSPSNLLTTHKNGHRNRIPRNKAALPLARSPTESMDPHHTRRRSDRPRHLRLVHHCATTDEDRHPLVRIFPDPQCNPQTNNISLPGSSHSPSSPPP